MSTMRTNFIGHIPDDLKHNATSVLGAFRDATRKAAQPGNATEVLDTAVKALGLNPNIFSTKGRTRVLNKMQRAFGDKLVNATGGVCNNGFCAVTFTVARISAEELRLFDVDAAAFPRCVVQYNVSEVGRVSRHAVARYIERCGMSSVSLADIAAAALNTLRFVRVMHSHGHIYGDLIPSPNSTGELVAVVDLRAGQLVTFLRSEQCGDRRKEWIDRFMRLDNMVNKSGTLAEHHKREYIALLNEGAQIFAETRETVLRLAA